MSFVVIISRVIHRNRVGCCALAYPTQLGTVRVQFETRKHKLITLMLSLLNLTTSCCKSSRLQNYNRRETLIRYRDNRSNVNPDTTVFPGVRNETPKHSGHSSGTPFFQHLGCCSMAQAIRTAVHHLGCCSMAQAITTAVHHLGCCSMAQVITTAVHHLGCCSMTQAITTAVCNLTVIRNIPSWIR